MKTALHRWKLTALSLAMFSGLASAGALQDLYLEARTADPQIAAAQAELRAAESLVPQARGALLPQLSLSGSRIANDTTQELRSGSRPVTRDYSFTAKNASLNLSLALLRPQAWAGLAQASAQVRQAEQQYRSAEHNLILRLSQAYLEALNAIDNVTLAAEQKAAIAEQLKQAKRYFEAGVGTVTDINEAQARYDSIVAQELAAQNNREIRLRAIEAIVGQLPPTLASLGQRLPLELPEPADVERWLEYAQTNNPQILAREAALDAAEREHYKSWAAHLPTADLVATRGRSENPSFTMTDTVNWSNTIGVQVSIPLFAGGATQGRVDQTSALRDRARHDLTGAYRSINQSTRQEYLNVINGVAQVNALQQAVKSNELALYSARKGQEAGVRTSFDILNAQQLLFSAKRDLAQARYAYVLGRLRLRAAAGLLGPDDVTLVDAWLDK